MRRKAAQAKKMARTHAHAFHPSATQAKPHSDLVCARQLRLAGLPPPILAHSPRDSQIKSRRPGERRQSKASTHSRCLSVPGHTPARPHFTSSPYQLHTYPATHHLLRLFSTLTTLTHPPPPLPRRRHFLRKGAWRFGPSLRSRPSFRSLHV